MYDIPKILKKICKNNDMILLMGAGDIFNITNDIYNHTIIRNGEWKEFFTCGGNNEHWTNNPLYSIE